VLKLNRREAAAHLGRTEASDEDLFGLLDDWQRHGVRIGLITDGPAPALLRFGGQAYRTHPPEIEVVNPIGSGDCLLAGVADGLLAGQEPLDSVRRGLACAAANAIVWDAGAIDPAEVRRFEEDGGIEFEPVARGGAGGTPPRLVRKTEGRRR
jgi:fructose-1-phosphate kinase PfkB-like protein